MFGICWVGVGEVVLVSVVSGRVDRVSSRVVCSGRWCRVMMVFGG